MNGRWILGLLAVTVLVFAGGCGKTQIVDRTSGAPRQVEPLTELLAQARPPIPDLPIPVGFKLDEGRSRNFEAAGARYVDHLYKGGDDKFAVARFYKRQMPVRRWTWVTDMFVQGDIMLDFEKNTERCRVVIKKGGLFHSTYIQAQLWTSGRIEPPASAAPAEK